MRVMIFLHGTVIMHAAAAGQPRAERVRQSARRDPSVTDFAACVPTEAAAELARSPGSAVRCVVVPEFGGLAHLPDDPAELGSRGG